MTPEELVEAARALVARATPGTEGLWALAATLLARQALEVAIQICLARRVPRVDELTFYTQLLALHDLTDAATARRAASLWSALSRATHHHGYELPPSAASLRGWIESVAELLGELARP